MKILTITGSVSGENASSTKAARIAEALLKEKYKNAETEYIDLNESEFAKAGLTSKTFANYFDNSIE